MASVNDTLVDSISLTIKAVDKMNQVTGGRDAIIQKTGTGGSAVSNIVVSSLGRSSPGISEVGKGSNVNASA